MDRNDWGPFCKLLKAADELTAGKPRSGEAVGLMFRILEEFTIDEVSKAIKEHIRTCKFAVQPADIFRILQGSAEEKSTVAWRVFLRALDRFGYYTSVRFPDPAYHYAIEHLGGWIRLGESWHILSEKEIEFRGREWRRLYEIGLRVASWTGEDGRLCVPPYFPGYHEWHNKSGGYLEHVPPVVDISDGSLIFPAALSEGSKSGISYLTARAVTDGSVVNAERGDRDE